MTSQPKVWIGRIFFHTNSYLQTNKSVIMNSSLGFCWGFTLRSSEIPQSGDTQVCYIKWHSICIQPQHSLLSPLNPLCVLAVSHVQLFAIPWTAAHQLPLSTEFSRQEYWSWLPFHSPGDLPDPAIQPGSPTLQADSLPSESPEKPFKSSLGSL